MKKFRFSLIILLITTVITFLACSNGSSGKSDGEGKKYSISIDENISNGSVTASKTSAAEGETITLSAKAADGYKLDFWNVTDADGESITVNNDSFVMPAKDVNVSAGFRLKQKHTVTYIDGIDNEEISVPEDTEEYLEDTTVTVKFTGIGNRSGYTFAGWSDGNTTYSIYGKTTFKMGSENVTLTAQWQAYIGTKSPAETKSVGDIIFSDGTAVSYSSGLTLTNQQKEKAIAVIYKVDGSNAYGVGLLQEKFEHAWCLRTAKGYNTNFTEILCTPSPNSENPLTFTGDIDGSDNFEKIKQALGDEDDTGDISNYPAFELAVNYKDKTGSHVKNTAYENGWYLPAVAELYDIHKEFATVDSALGKCGGSTFSKDYVEYWSSSQYSDPDSFALLLDVKGGHWLNNGKAEAFYFVCCVRKFN